MPSSYSYRSCIVFLNAEWIVGSKVNTRFVETFVMLARLGSFRATARALHATPAAISLRVKSLEQELGTELIDRSANAFQLTASGEYLLRYARSVVAAAHQMQAAARADTLVQGRLRLGVVESVVHSWLTPYLQQLNSSHPVLEIELAVDTGTLLQKRLIGGELDLVLRVDGSDHRDLVSEAMAILPVRWIAKKGLLPLQQDSLVEQVLQRPILTFGRGTATERTLQEIVAALAGQAGLPLSQVRMTCSASVTAIIQLVMDGYGVAALPSLLVAPLLASGELVELSMPVCPPSFVISMCRRADAGMMVLVAAGVARLACDRYCQKMDRRLIEPVG
jgi:DNA-binding transcriptional LysR family regulator